MNNNKYGLSRTIDENTKRIIRQRSGFGCIFCGNAIYTYEHIDPEFSEAKKHDPEKICLLCPIHQQKSSQRRLSKQQILEHYQHPIAHSRGYVNDYLELRSRIYVALGRIFLTETNSVLKINDQEILRFSQPRDDEPMKLSAKFFDSKSNLLLEIRENEILGFTKNWDIEQKGPRTIIRRKRGDIALQLRVELPDILEVEKIHMFYQGAEILSNSLTGQIFIRTSSGSTIDFPKGQIITKGLYLTKDSMSFDSVIMIGAQEGLGLAKMNYRDFIDTGRIHGP